MIIERNTVAIFHYTLFSEDGEQLESSAGSDPTAYLHGHGGIIPGLQSEFEGREAGETFSATLSPGQAYGESREDRVQRVPIKHLVFRGKLRPGMAVQLNTSEGRFPVTVIKAGRHSADVDTNHPLAGQTLRFEVEILEVRAASAEEVSHGHAHGPGGHQH